jgi:hypothetical protein
MTIYWSAFFSLFLLLALVSCGSEQFGTTPQSNASQLDAVAAFQQASCSNHTLIKPEVDILYVVDNSTSSYYLASDIKSALQNTINSISKDFDYRIIGTPLLATPAGNEDYQVLAKSPDSLPSTASNKKVTSASDFSFFANPISGSQEPGLERIRSFIAEHSSVTPASEKLLRQGAYLFVVLVSNGFDTDIESKMAGGSGETLQNLTVYNSRKSAFITLKKALKSQQFRLFSLVTHPGCSKSGWNPSPKSYIQMSKDLYKAPIIEDATPLTYLTDQGADMTPDSYDLCSGQISGVFTSVNNSIKQIIVPHTYNKWPITFTETATGLNTADIKVYKSSPNSAPTLLPSSSWTYLSNSTQSSVNTRILPTVGEPTTARHLIQFTTGNNITYPDCIQITSTSNLEYFGYVVMGKAPNQSSIVLKINGQTIPQSAANGWSYIGQQTRNIKVQYNGFSDLPAAIRTGYMVQLNGSSNYYKSGDNVEIYYVPATN